MNPAERKAIINRGRTDLGLTRQCKLLKSCRSSLYCTPVGMDADTQKTGEPSGMKPNAITSSLNRKPARKGGATSVRPGIVKGNAAKLLERE